MVHCLFRETCKNPIETEEFKVETGNGWQLCLSGKKLCRAALAAHSTGAARYRISTAHPARPPSASHIEQREQGGLVSRQTGEQGGPVSRAIRANGATGVQASPVPVAAVFQGWHPQRPP